MPSMSGGRIGELGDHIPGLREGSGSLGAVMGMQRMVTAPIGAPLLVDSATYQHAVFVCPCDGAFIKELWLSGAVSIGSGTNTFAVDNYDASANAARNVLSTTNIDPDTITALEGLKLTLSATPANLYMDEGDVLNVTLVCGTQTTAGQGYVLTAVIVVPEIA